MKYDYQCPNDGLIQVEGVAQDFVQCRCGSQAKRLRGFAVNKTSLKVQARWDPVVGQYVRNDREFQELLKAGQARTEKELNMPVKTEQVDARDTEGLAELHGHKVDDRLEIAEQTAKIKHDASVKV